MLTGQCVGVEGCVLDHYALISFKVCLQHFNLWRTHFDGVGILVIEGEPTMDSKEVHNQQPGSPSQSGQGNPSNATKQPAQSREQQPGQQTQQAPKKDVQGGDKKEEPQKTGTGKH